jgi:hypothetical protein
MSCFVAFQTRIVLVKPQINIICLTFIKFKSLFRLKYINKIHCIKKTSLLWLVFVGLT